jgi:HK97 family phage prohead protease
MPDTNKPSDCLFSRDAAADPRRRFLFTRESKFALVKAGNGVVTLKGYPIVFNQLSDDRGGYFVRIMPGSPSFVQQMFAVTDHDYGKPLGVSDAGSLRTLPSDSYGVPAEIDLPDTTYARDLVELIDKKIVKGMSFAAIPSSVKSHETIEDGKRIVNFDSFCSDEFTVTAIPAFVGTSIGIVGSGEFASEEARKTAAMRLSTLQREQRLRLQRLMLDALGN